MNLTGRVGHLACAAAPVAAAVAAAKPSMMASSKRNCDFTLPPLAPILAVGVFWLLASVERSAR